MSTYLFTYPFIDWISNLEYMVSQKEYYSAAELIPLLVAAFTYLAAAFSILCPIVAKNRSKVRFLNHCTLCNPTCYTGKIKLFSSLTKYLPEATNSSLKLWFIKLNCMSTSLIYRYTFWTFRVKFGSGAESDFFSADRIPGKKFRSFTPATYYNSFQNK